VAGVALMAAAGMAWGLYSLAGRSAGNPLGANARSFVLAALPALIVGLAFGDRGSATARGLLLAVCSGAVTSGVGYAIWYRALRGLSAIQAAVVQLSVPVLAASAAVPVLGERPTARLALAGAAVLGGVA